jgi:hypothetical protein
MKTKGFIILLALLSITLNSCGPGKPTFEISGSPDPIFYGYCGTLLTFKVIGPGDNLRINSVIVGYNLFNGSGGKVKSGTVTLSSSLIDPPVTYTGSLDFFGSDLSSPGSSPDKVVIDFGDGRIDFAATVYATYITPPSSGPDETYYFTSTKSVKLLPCGPTPTVAPIILVAPSLTPTPVPTKKPKDGRPSCSAEPNNPNCKP